MLPYETQTSEFLKLQNDLSRMRMQRNTAVREAWEMRQKLNAANNTAKRLKDKLDNALKNNGYAHREKSATRRSQAPKQSAPSLDQLPPAEPHPSEGHRI